MILLHYEELLQF